MIKSLRELIGKTYRGKAINYLHIHHKMKSRKASAIQSDVNRNVNRASFSIRNSIKDGH